MGSGIRQLHAQRQRGITHPTRPFWDIGANVGFYTLAAATTGVAVHAFEPSLRNALMLQMSLQRNSVQHRVLLSTFALSDRAEPMALGTSEQNQGNLQHARLGSRVRIFKKPTPPSRGTHIAAFRLDDVLQAALKLQSI